jgi:hypothetical protein
MIQVVDGNAGPLGSGRHTEATALLARRGSGDVTALGHVDGVVSGLLAPDRVVAESLTSRWSRQSRAQRMERGPVMAWGRRCATWTMSCGLGPAARADVSLLDGPRDGAVPKKLVRLLSDFDRIMTYDEADAAAWRAAGLPGRRLEVCEARFEPTEGRSRRELRAALGAGESERLIFPIASPWDALDAQRFVFMIGLLRVIGIEASAIVPAQAWRLAEARVFRRRSGLGTRLLVVDGPMTPWLGACDAAFADSAGLRGRVGTFVPRGAMRVLMAAATSCGVPVAVSPLAFTEASAARPMSVAEELSPLVALLRARVESRPGGMKEAG